MYEKRKAMPQGYDYSAWHNSPSCNVEIITHNGRAQLHCKKCRCICELEASTTDGGCVRCHVEDTRRVK